jgi:hypothetical protein
MAVKKSAKKTTVKKTPAKKTTATKTAAKKKTGGKRKATAEETATGSKPGEGAAAKKRTPVSKSAEPKKAKDKVSSTSVNLGHVFSLRPRVSKTFRQADFLTARQLLQDEDYANIEEAARAVAEKALDLTHKGPPKRGFKPGR